jgi:hypothetical protein
VLASKKGFLRLSAYSRSSAMNDATASLPNMVFRLDFCVCTFRSQSLFAFLKKVKVELGFLPPQPHPPARGRALQHKGQHK